MKRTAVCLLLFSSALIAQTAETAFFRAVMLPENEVPPTGITAHGTADILAHVVRDSTGQIISGTVDFLVRVNFASDVTATGLHIHNGPAGVNAGVVLNTGLSAGNSLAVKGGGDTVHLPVQVTPDAATALAALRGLFQDPSQYYVNIHTTDFPNGAMRGQLQKADAVLLMGIMSSDNEVPPPTNVKASGVAQVVAIGTRDSSGNLTSGEVYLTANYVFPSGVTFTGFHIHPGAAGSNGPVVIGATLPANLASDPSGTGVLGPYYTEITTTNAQQVATFNNLFVNPEAQYINAHTTANPSGVLRAQLRRTDTTSFPVLMDSANEPGTPSVKATAPAVVTVHTLRNENGSVAAGTVFFDVDYRFPAQAQFTGLHIHDGKAGVNGPVTVPMIPTYDPGFTSATGFGAYYSFTPPVTSTAGLATLNDIVINPESHYVNMHTTTDTGGAIRAQLAPAVTAVPAAAATISANLDKNATIVSPGELISIFGTNLSKVTTDLSGWEGQNLPLSLGGTSVDIGGKHAALLYVSPNQINAQVPLEVPAGSQTVVVTNSNGAGNTTSLTVASVAPAIFFSPVAAVLKNADFSLVSSTNPAHAGDAILIYATGLGQTTPALTSGALVPSGTIANTAKVTVSMGGKDAPVIYSIASPFYAGLYQVAVTVPTGLTGNVATVLTQGSASSNSVNIPVQ
ncbi:MAG TPA: CHRD domain-containing protein [Bryobacteraceae bacterium]|nr:CHRD domain-containing protein [Bryobacteraceae bacterium]